MDARKNLGMILFDIVFIKIKKHCAGKRPSGFRFDNSKESYILVFTDANPSQNDHLKNRNDQDFLKIHENVRVIYQIYELQVLSHFLQ